MDCRLGERDSRQPLDRRSIGTAQKHGGVHHRGVVAKRLTFGGQLLHGLVAAVGYAITDPGQRRRAILNDMTVIAATLSGRVAGATAKRWRDGRVQLTWQHIAGAEPVRRRPRLAVATRRLTAAIAARIARDDRRLRRAPGVNTALAAGDKRRRPPPVGPQPALA